MSRGRIFFIIVLAIAAAAVILFVRADHTLQFAVGPAPAAAPAERIAEAVKKVVDPSADIGPQPQLANPPPVVKAIYATGYSAGSEKKVQYFLDLLNTTELNAIVLDIKDYTGAVSYKTDIPAVNEYKAWERKIPKINALIKRFHDAGVYVIGRIAVFQDQALVAARPDLAVHSSSTGGVWKDYKGVKWMDTSSKDVWDYNIAIARDALARGFDEINFDYIRFPSDGNLADAVFPSFDLQHTLKHKVVGSFFDYVHQQLPDANLSADLFGLVTEDKGDMGIGQHLEDALPNFTVIAPMVYPSHYAPLTHGFKNPADHPYDIIKYAMDSAVSRLSTYDSQREKVIKANASSTAASSSSPVAAVPPAARAVYRPWIQDFNLGATYTAAMVRAQIQAVYDAGCSATMGVTIASSTPLTPRVSPCEPSTQGFMVWNPSNVYTKGAFLPE